MKTWLGSAILAGCLTSAVPMTANAQYVTVETDRVCRDSDGDRVPCGRRVYRERDDDRRVYRERYRDRDGISIGIGRRGIRIEGD